MIHTVLSNARHPEYGAAAIPFPIPRDEYDHCIDLLEALEIGDASRRDCRLDEIHSPVPILKRLEKVAVNADELDYLAKRLDSFTDREMAQFQSMAVRLGLFEMTDLINLTFCCQQATVITDFSDLEAIGRDHFMNQNGGCISHEQLEELDARSEALQLILNELGTVTPYGVVYDNGMKLEQLYDGRHLPSYLYDAILLTVALTSREEPEDTGNITWIYLPASKEQIDRALLRSGIADLENMCFLFGDSEFPSEIDAALDFRQESIYDLNDLAWAVDRLSPDDCKKLGAVVEMAEPEYAFQIRHLAENLDQFEFVPNVHTPAEYGRCMIQESGHFEYDENLEGFYDYEKYGLQRMGQESGMFTDQGYISYHGTMRLEELMMEEPSEQDFQMGGM